MSDEDFYRENILDHYKHPHNWSPPAEEIESPHLEFHDLNPLCGDELRVQLALTALGGPFQVGSARTPARRPSVAIQNRKNRYHLS